MIHRYRLSRLYIEYIKQTIQLFDSKAKIYLFGSRLNTNSKGGDIDLLILTKERLPIAFCRKIKIELYKVLGWQKIDIVNFTFDEKHPFKSIILPQAKQL